MFTVKININSELHIITNLNKEQCKELKRLRGGFISNGPCTNRRKCYFCQNSEIIQFQNFEILNKKYEVGVNEHLLFHFLEFLYKQKGRTGYTMVDRGTFSNYLCC